MEDTGDQTTFVELNRRRLQEEEEDEEDSKPKKNWCERFLQSRRTRLLAVAFLFALVPLLIYYLVVVPVYTADDVLHTCAISRGFRILCGDGNFTEEDCKSRHCCFDFTDKYCYHFMPSKYVYLRRHNYFIPSERRDVFGNNATDVMIATVQRIDKDKVKIIIHTGTHETIPLSDNDSYEVIQYKDHLGFDIVRKGTEDVILTTGLGPVMASENYLELSFYMGNTLFGLDELYFGSNETFRKVIYKNRNDHTTIPAFMAYNGNYSGLYLDIAGPVEISVLPSRLISVRILSNAEMSFTVVTGPTPKDVQQQLYQFNLPPRWLLKPHICRDGPTDLPKLVEEYFSFYENNSIEYATDCLHQNLYYLYLLNETEAHNLTKALDLINQDGRFVMTLYPQVLNNTDLYEIASGLGLLYSLGNETYHSVHLDQQVAYLDYSANEEKVDEWFNAIRSKFSNFDIKGYSFKDNWPDDGAFVMERIEELPYLNGTFTSPMSNTIPWNATTPPDDTTPQNATSSSLQRHLRIHNSYVKGQVAMLTRAFNSEHEPNMDDPFIFTSAYTTGLSDTIAQVQNMNATWVDLKKAIRMVLSHGLFANPLISIPVCGSTSEFKHENKYILCSRWYITAATFPIFSVSSDTPRRDHSALPTGHSRNIALDALNIREMLTDYLYTVLQRNEPVTRPMFYDFYMDEYTHVLDEQYMLGDALLVVQPLLQEMYLIVVYLPPEAGGFYEFFGGEYFGRENISREYYDENYYDGNNYDGNHYDGNHYDGNHYDGNHYDGNYYDKAYSDNTTAAEGNATLGNLGNVTLSVLVETDWLVFMREGKIVPLLKENNTYTMAIGLSLSDGKLTASGTLFLKNTVLKMTADEEMFTISKGNLDCDEDESIVISDARVYGLELSAFKVLSLGDLNLCEIVENELQVMYIVDSDVTTTTVTTDTTATTDTATTTTTVTE